MDQQIEALAERSVIGRYLELDALRGLAACIVLGNHLRFAFSYQPPWFAVPFFAGHEAVVLFFVLSGFVLSLPFWNKNTNGPYDRYLVRRFFRIYVPFAAALIVAAVCAHFFLFSTLPLGAWFDTTWQTPLTPSFFVSQFLMTPDGKLNTAFWSLRYEVQLSIVFPILLLGLRRLGTFFSLLIAVCVYCLGKVAALHISDPYWYQETLQFAPMFILGALLARRREELRQLWSQTGLLFRSGFCFGACCLFFYGNSVARHIGGFDWIFGDACVLLGACMLVLLVIFSTRIRAIFRSRLPTYLGRISYSIYLLHGTVLFVLLNLLYGKVPIAVIVIAFFVCSFAAAHAFCVLVEEPSLRLGKRLSSRVGLTSAIMVH